MAKQYGAKAADEPGRGFFFHAVQFCSPPPVLYGNFGFLLPFPDVKAKRGQRALLPTGFAIELPGPEYVALIFARSSLGARHGVALPNGVGVIDSDYRGEVHVALANHGDEAYVIQPGERVAQMAVVPVAHAVLQEVGELGGTARGEGGFGSTGKL